MGLYTNLGVLDDATHKKKLIKTMKYIPEYTVWEIFNRERGRLNLYSPEDITHVHLEKSS